MTDHEHYQSPLSTRYASEAMRAGASFLVVGRPITGAADPRAAATSIVAEIRALN